jgi:response regulator RpfG family c-di-GMP phosphodiesterase
MTARLLEQDSSIPDEVISIIRQHHEVSDGSGFPNKADHRRIKPYSCLFIISLDLATFILNNKDWKIEDFIIRYKDNYRGVTFKKIIRQLTELKGIKG